MPKAGGGDILCAPGAGSRRGMARESEAGAGSGKVGGSSRWLDPAGFSSSFPRPSLGFEPQGR